MKFSWRSDKGRPEGPVCHESARVVASKRYPGVRYRIARVSFGRRTALIARIRELAGRAEYHSADDSSEDRIEAALVERELERLYVEWGLEGIEGLQIDGEPATGATLLERGPEDLFREISQAIQQECGLSEDERKN